MTVYYHRPNYDAPTKETHKIRVVILSILAGIIGFLLSPYSITYDFELITIDIPWSLIFPMIVSLAYGIKAALITSFAGGAWYPFLLWPDNGYANFVTFITLVVLYVTLGFHHERMRQIQNKWKFTFILIALIIFYLLVVFIFYRILFPASLKLNPPFWNDDVLYEMPAKVLNILILKVIINYTLIAIFCESLLKTPLVRRVLGLKINPWMRQNGMAMFLSLLIAVTVWFCFYIIDNLISQNRDVLSKDYVSLSFLVIFFSGGILGRFMIQYLESKLKAEDALMKSEGQIKALIRNIPSIVYRGWANKLRSMQIISPQIEKITGYKPTLFLDNSKQPYAGIIHAEDRQIVYESMMEQIKQKNEFELEYRITDNMGNLHWMHEKGSVFEISEENRIMIDGVIDDISRRKQIEIEVEKYRSHLEELVVERTARLQEVNDELNQALKDLKSAQLSLVQSEKMASLGLLTAGVAHEINNPLNFIQGGYSGLEKYFLEHGYDADEGIPIMLNSIKTGIQRAAGIVKSLNEFSRNREAFDEACKISAIVDNCIAMLNHQIKKRIEINKQFIENPPIIKGNSGKIHQVYLNILNNAVQAIEGNGKIDIVIKTEGKWLITELIDNGKGIKEEDLSRITDPFFTTKEPGKGTGLGLSICYAIVKEHKGKMHFDSVWKKGTKATISWPIIKE